MDITDPKFTTRTISQFDYDLTFDQQKHIERDFKNHNLTELTNLVYGKATLDEHSQEYDNVRKYLAKVKRSSKEGAKPEIEFTQEQIDFIERNAALMRPIELAKAIFKDRPDVKVLGQEHHTVANFVKALGIEDPDHGTDGTNKDYSPPKADSRIVSLINESDINADFLPKNMPAEQREQIDALRGYLNSKMFMVMMNGLEKQSHRDILESTFVMSTYDKPDLNSEELNMYITLCRDYVFAAQVQIQLEMINKQMDESMGDSEEAQRMRMTFIEAYSNKMNEYHKINDRMKQLQIALSNKRSVRMQNTTDSNLSLTRFVKLWRQREERKKAIIIAKARNLELAKEVARISTVPEYIAHVMGISEAELLST